MPRRVLADKAEFLLLTLWDDGWDSIAAFTGEGPDQARYYPEDEDFLISRPETVDHFEMVIHRTK